MKQLIKLCVSLVAVAVLALPMVACVSDGYGPEGKRGPVMVQYKCSMCGVTDSEMSNKKVPECCGENMVK